MVGHYGKHYGPRANKIEIIQCSIMIIDINADKKSSGQWGSAKPAFNSLGMQYSSDCAPLHLLNYLSIIKKVS